MDRFKDHRCSSSRYRSLWREVVEDSLGGQWDYSASAAVCAGIATQRLDWRDIERSFYGGAEGDSLSLKLSRFFSGRVPSYSYERGCSVEQMVRWLEEGNLLLVHGWFGSEGRCVVLDGFARQMVRRARWGKGPVEEEPLTASNCRINVLDPSGEFSPKDWQYKWERRLFVGSYSSRVIWAACAGAQDPPSARYRYASGGVSFGASSVVCHRFQAPPMAS